MQDEAPTSNWGMTQDQVWEMEETKKKFQLPETAVITPQSESAAPSTVQIDPSPVGATFKSQMESEARYNKLVGKKFDQGKPRMELLPPVALNEVSKALAYGGDKYGDHNWRAGLKWSRLCGASLRHIMAWLGGENTDPESGCHHLAHAACNILMLIESAQLDLGKDDRWKK